MKERDRNKVLAIIGIVVAVIWLFVGLSNGQLKQILPTKIAIPVKVVN